MAVQTRIIGNACLFLGDAREILPTIGPFDAVVTDPPYGIGEDGGKAAGRQRRQGGNSKALADQREYADLQWDTAPIDPALMAMVRSAARWQIIFGGNYYDCPPASCWLVWDKENGANDFADCELAWTNLPKAVRRIRFMWNGMLRQNGEERGDHPTQKPIGVMEWALNQLPQGSHSIIDPFMGSGTTGVACARLGLAFIGIEREPSYFDIACRRIEEAYRQPRLFTDQPAKPVQQSLLTGTDG